MYEKKIRLQKFPGRTEKKLDTDQKKCCRKNDGATA
jgi:hypothetical protein